MHRFLFDFENFLNDLPVTAILLAVAGYVCAFLAVIIATQSHPERATEWAVALLSVLTFWSVWTGIPIVRYLHKRFQGPKR
ncbi:hypothetical protein [Aliiroseovarius sp.]|uniref:hypothetical protein n=1 Tax=Aliiroseovarius sp. TaxID=1872442 RepID=UPI003BA918AA